MSQSTTFYRYLVLIILSGFFGVTTTFSQQFPELLYYKFDVPGTSVTNQALTPIGNNPASITGTGLSIGGTGQFGSALVGTGVASTGGVINTGWNTNFTGSFTLAFWTSNIAPSSTLWYIFGDAGANSFRCFTNGVASANNWMVRGAGLPDLLITGAATMAPNMIHVVYDATAGQYRGYVNGVLNVTVAATMTPYTGTGLQIGGYSSNSNLNGLMDEFRIYNRALTQTEITNTWNIPLGATAVNDAGVTAISSPPSPASPGISNIEVSLMNYGTDTLSSATIGWSVNGVVQTPFSWTGSLAQYATATGIVIGTYNFPIGLQTIKAWSSLPNGVVDSAAYNDTTTKTFMVCNCFPEPSL